MTSLIIALPHVFIPLTVIIAITSVIGFLGNLMAFYVFNFRFPSTGFNKLMATLAAYDVMACIIHMPMDIATFFPIGETRSYLCKITCFQLAFTSTGSALVLLVIAIVRFYGIHKPLMGTFSSKSATTVIIVSILTASGIGLPITFLFGAGEFTTDTNTTAAICAVESRFSKSVGPISYYFVLAGLYGASFCVHTVMYARSFITVWKRCQMFEPVSGKTNAVVMTPKSRHRLRIPVSTDSDSVIDQQLSQITGMRNMNNSDESGRNQSFISDKYSSRISPISSNYPSPIVDNRDLPQVTASRAARGDSYKLTNNAKGNKVKKPIPAKRTGIRQDSNIGTPYSTASTLPVRGGAAVNNVNLTSYRVLVMVIAISLAYFLSYAPHFGVMFYLFTHDNDVFVESAQSLVWELLMRSFFLNNVLDPVLLGLLSADFRREVKRVLSNIFHTVCRR